jgi:hypothetical protein
LSYSQGFSNTHLESRFSSSIVLWWHPSNLEIKGPLSAASRHWHQKRRQASSTPHLASQLERPQREFIPLSKFQLPRNPALGRLPGAGREVTPLPGHL